MSPRRALVLLGCCGLASCLIYTTELLESADPGGVCVTAGECPGQDTDCGTRSCNDGTCGFDYAAEGVSCTDAMGKVCDGNGSCVECTGPEHCGDDQVCSTNTCVGEGSLGLGEPCSVNEACTSQSCVDGVCCDNACGGTCVACDTAGNVGSCANVPAGADPDQECAAADTCNGQGECGCQDGATNGSESDIDCGGDACPTCTFGQACSDPADCSSGVCTSNVCEPLCGDNVPEGTEQCDDGNNNSYDGCSATCRNPTSHLIISEFVVQPSGAEYIEIYNPTAATVSLSDMWLADYPDYHAITTTGSPASSDFAVNFPTGATIASGAFVVVSLETASDFLAAHLVAPDYDIATMGGQASSASGLTNGDEMIVLFEWDGAAATVTDVDYVVYGNTTDAMDKSLVNGYVAETPVASQVAADAPDTDGRSTERCDTAEYSETKSGGNGTSSHDETSEDGQLAWTESTLPTPGAGPAVGSCP